MVGEGRGFINSTCCNSLIWQTPGVKFVFPCTGRFSLEGEKVFFFGGGGISWLQSWVCQWDQCQTINLFTLLQSTIAHGNMFVKGVDFCNGKINSLVRLTYLTFVLDDKKATSQLVFKWIFGCFFLPKCICSESKDRFK